MRIKKDFISQKNIELDLRSFRFSEIIPGLIAISGRFYQNLEKSFFTQMK